MMPGLYERLLIEFINRQGHYYQSTIDAARILAANGFDRETTANYILTRLTSGRNPMSDLGLYMAISQHLKNNPDGW